MAGFADHFSRDSASYARFRPGYPPALFDWLATLTGHRGVVWDCGTGTGQAAVLLAPHFRTVIASDASRSQIRAAARAPGVHYLAATAEASGLRDGAIDLVTVAQAMHWLDRERFFRELDRVLAPDGALAIWSYGMVRSSPEIDAVIEPFYRDTVGPWWPPERSHVESGYRSFALPIEEAATPAFAMTARLTLSALLGYVRTWSAVGRYQRDTGIDPVPELERGLAAVWGNPDEPRRFDWPLSVRAGRWLRGAEAAA
jgi:SAM-dependent methyltransferase